MSVIPVDEITAGAREARQADLGRLITTFFMFLFFAPGWLAGRTRYCMALGISAARVGYRQGAKLHQSGQTG